MKLSIKNRAHTLFLLSLSLLLVSCIHQSRYKPSPDNRTDLFSEEPSGRITERQLQAEIMVFADHFVMVFWQAMDQLQRADLPPERKLAVEYGKLLYTTSAISIAAQPSPVASLLDMITFIRLGHKAVESYWVPKVYGPAGQPLITAYRRLEDDVWQLAALVLSEVQQQEVREIIDRWQKEHPNQWYVSDIHLEGFTTARGRPVHPFAKEAQGLLSSVNQTLLKVDEAMMVADRALFLGERMPRMMTLQSELLVAQFTENPMVYKFVSDFSEFQTTAGRLSQAVEDFPDDFATERQKVIAQFESLLASERIAWIQAFSDKEQEVLAVLTKAQKTFELGSKTAQDYSALVTAINSLTGDNSVGDDVGQDRVDVLDKANRLVEKSQQTAEELNLLLANLERFISPQKSDDAAFQIRKMIDALGEKEEELINRAFLYGMALIFFALIGALAVALCYRYLAGRIFRNQA